MKFLVIGGCGVQARPALNLLIECEDVECVTIADINLALAQQLISELDDSRLTAIYLDAFDHKKMVAVMSDHDVVINCSGPYHLLGVRILKASIEAGKHYVDYCDDVEPTLEMLSLSEQAKAQGVSAIIGLGASPGLFNLLAVKAAQELDSTEEINMYWTLSADEPEGPAVIDHMLHILSGDVPQFLNGKTVLVPALSGLEEEVDLPAPHGRLNCAYVGHPEPSTLPRYIPGLRQVVNKYAAPLEELQFFQGLQDLGLMSKEPISVKGQQIAPKDLLVALLASVPQEVKKDEGNGSAAILDVKGRKNGSACGIRFTVTGDMAPMTSIPAVLGALMLARGEIHETGVMAPEGCVPPDAIIDPLCEMGLANIQQQSLEG